MELSVPEGLIRGDLESADNPRGLVVFAHGSGSSRHSPRNRYVAGVLRDGGFSTLLADLLTEQEEAVDARTRQIRFDIGLLAARVALITDWVRSSHSDAISVGYFGASTGAAAAIIAAANREDVKAVVSRGGRPDLAGEALPRLKTSTLLIVGELDGVVIEMNKEAASLMTCPHEIAIVAGAGHLFEEAGTLQKAAVLARDWFVDHL